MPALFTRMSMPPICLMVSVNGFFNGGVIGNIDLDAAIEIPDGDFAAFGRNAFGHGLADA